MSSTTKEESLEITVDGKPYTGTLTTTGDQQLSFEVEYQGKKKRSPQSWGTSDEELHKLQVNARTCLLSLVCEAEGL
jgi:hypothetical protein